VKNGDLLHFLLDLQKECGGVIPFERYMQEALYNPNFGYYSSQIRDVGAAGDFSTSATLDKSLGRSIADWITTRSKELGWRRIPVIEIGAGNGALARSVLRHLGWKKRWTVDYMIHETSLVLRELQQKQLRRQGVRWINSLPEFLEKTQGDALIFSNELVDAFPCRLFQKVGGIWQELGISITEQGVLSEQITSRTPADPWFYQFAHLPDGQRIERHDSYRDWLRDWSASWKSGAMLTIDYGESAKTLYERRPAGSLRAYWRHQRFTGANLYARFGKQDLTADVNFSDLISWGEELGWQHHPLVTQREFVSSWIKNLSEQSTLPSEAGDAFKVLEQTPA
jgi:SAM-dependent MidA family methyltransferase